MPGGERVKGAPCGAPFAGDIIFALNINQCEKDQNAQADSKYEAKICQKGCDRITEKIHTKEPPR